MRTNKAAGIAPRVSASAMVGLLVSLLALLCPTNSASGRYQSFESCPPTRAPLAVGGSNQDLTPQERNSVKRFSSFTSELARLLREHAVCESTNARFLARMSSEPAETVAKAAIAACYSDRDKIAPLEKKFGLPPMTVEEREASEAEWEASEEKNMKFIIFEIIKQRAHSLPANGPRPRGTPL